MQTGAAFLYSWLLALLIAVLAAMPRHVRADAPAVDAPTITPALTDDALAIWRKAILPGDDETAWERIGWLPTLREGVLEAASQDKPLLLWVMNGHPLGCT